MDIINGLFEILGFAFILPSILLLYRQKQVRGISPTHVAFFSAWGYWNLLYYPSLGQWASTVGAVFLALANTTYWVMLVYYKRKEAAREARLCYGRGEGRSCGDRPGERGGNCTECQISVRCTP